MFDNEKIICKNRDGIRVMGTVEWLGQRLDANELQVEQIVYRKTPSSPDEYLAVDEGITARELWEDLNPTIPECILIDYFVTTGMPFDFGYIEYAERAWIGTLEEYGDDMYEISRLTGNPRSHAEIGSIIDNDIESWRIIVGVLTGDLFKGELDG